MYHTRGNQPGKILPAAYMAIMMSFKLNDITPKDKKKRPFRLLRRAIDSFPNKDPVRSALLNERAWRRDMPFDLEKAEARVSTKREKRFLKLLRAKRYVIFDWDEYTLWVLKDYKTDAKSPKKWMAGDEFLDAINYGEVAEDYLVLMLELNGITVEIRDCGSFKNKEERTKFFGDIREAASFFRTLPEIR